MSTSAVITSEPHDEAQVTRWTGEIQTTVYP